MSAPVDLDAIERWLDPATPEAWPQAMRDEALVLHAREDVPALVAEVRALRAAVEAVHAAPEEGRCRASWVTDDPGTDEPVRWFCTKPEGHEGMHLNTHFRGPVSWQGPEHLRTGS